MNKENKKITDIDLASFFIQNTEKENLISELFDFFSFDCLTRTVADPAVLDKQIADFEEEQTAESLSKIIETLRNASHRSENFKELTEKIKSHLTENFHEDTSIESIASELNISYYYMCHLFKTQTGFSPNTYRNRLKIEYSAFKLNRTDEKISEIAIMSGFNNVSYFTEMFTKIIGVSPSLFKEKLKKGCIQSWYTVEDIKFALMHPSLNFFENSPCELPHDTAKIYTVHNPNEEFNFLHEAAIIEFKGVLYASWYCCPKTELHGYTPICEKRSFDGGKTWTELNIVADDKSGKILYCPPVYGICDGKLYMLMNQMVAPDHIHSLDLYVLNETTDKFEILWSKPIPFKLNTNVVTLPNGKLMLPGRIAKLDGFPNTPAVLISDSGKIDCEWRLVKIAENGNLPDGKKLVHPEISVICNDNILYMFCRNDQREPSLVYISKDFGESWSQAHIHDIPFRGVKIYGGTLSDGRHYIIGNIDESNRSKLGVYFSQKGKMVFDKYIILSAKENPCVENANACHYPCAYEANNKLYIIATVNLDGVSVRGAVLFVIDLKDI